MPFYLNPYKKLWGVWPKIVKTESTKSVSPPFYGTVSYFILHTSYRDFYNFSGFRHEEQTSWGITICKRACCPQDVREIFSVDRFLMQRPVTFDSTTHNMEVFCHMLLEEFLTTRSMHSTLRAFRKEWDRPTEVCHMLNVRPSIESATLLSL